MVPDSTSATPPQGSAEHSAQVYGLREPEVIPRQPGRRPDPRQPIGPAVEPQWEVPEEILRKVRKGHRRTVIDLLSKFHPAVYRMATNLAKRPEIGEAVAKDVMSRSLWAMPQWDDPGEPARWFRHHTVIAARAAITERIITRGDVLLDHAPVQPPRPDYLAFVRAVRTLAPQQREAFLLHRGEHFGLRPLAVTMDCSVEAARTHLEAATDALRLVAGERFEDLSRQLTRAYRAATPQAGTAIPFAKKAFRRRYGSTVARALAWIAVIAFLVAVVAGAWWLIPLLEL